ncbi:phospholipase A2 inhibitor gamma subunit B-like [Podarcis raffonei]|uniref:phospholipase A2 inhibitor gamma subunit B-like n=1 Tax=Podarcis raffonei TaxID=65483 RepID=UPI002329901C|nr:phospholipase A2 inhibitor gamma subunit B-like [Podarcis raffonei]
MASQGTKLFAHTSAAHFFSRTMPAALGLFLFSVLLTPGDSLECETCTAAGASCKGSMTKCGADDDTCFVAFSESKIAGKSYERILKGCAPALVCSLGPFYVNLGQMFTSRGMTICCEGAECSSDSAQLPPMMKKVNGKTCPACYSLTPTCPAKVTKCTGIEDHCLDASIKTGGFGITMKGCTTKTYCDIIQLNALSRNFKSTLRAVTSAILDGKCEPASKAPPSLRFPLLALSWLLLVKILLQ